MNLKKIAAITVAALMTASPVLAELVFPDLSYRTGPYAANGTPVSDGFNDYFTLLNERDGGIGGVMTRVEQCETGYSTEKGVECYEATKGDGALVYMPLSTGITYQLIPKVTADGIPMLTTGYGRTSAANGAVFREVFNFPANYWTGASVAVNHILDVEGGDLNGKTIALLYHNSAYGKEPIRTLEELAKKHGFNLTLLPVDHPGQEQKSQWLQIRRESPDYVLMWGWGIMNQVAIQEAANIRFPMDKFIGIWWSGSENDVAAAGEAANGYKALTFHQVGTDFPVFADMQKYVVDTGKASGDGSHVGEVLYNRGMYGAMLVAEAAKVAQAMHGTAQITPAMMRDGLENLVVSDETMEAIGFKGFGPNFSVTCANHGGPGLGAVQQWDASNQSWTLITDFIEPDMSIIQPLIDEDSAAYAAENNITPGCN